MIESRKRKQTKKLIILEFCVRTVVSRDCKGERKHGGPTAEKEKQLLPVQWGTRGKNKGNSWKKAKETKIYVVPPDKIPDCSSFGPFFWKTEMTTARTSGHRVKVNFS